jgi:hypothetical protein
VNRTTRSSGSYVGTISGSLGSRTTGFSARPVETMSDCRIAVAGKRKRSTRTSIVVSMGTPHSGSVDEQSMPAPSSG